MGIYKAHATVLEREIRRYELSISAANIGVWDLSIDSNVVYLSNIWKAQIGYLEGELENSFSTWIDHLHPDESDKIQKNVNDY